MMPVELSGNHWTGLISIAANCDDRLDLLLEKLVHVFRVMAGNVEADLLHRLDGQGMNVASGF